jgi:hypothetical protein
MFNKDLGEKALIVNLNIGVWSARKTDKNVLREISNLYHSDQNHGSFSKLLISKTRLEAIKDIASAARKYHNEMTLPWMDGGGRLLPSKDFQDYSFTMSNYQTEFYTTVDDFVNSYNSYIQEGLDKLGQIADTKDYPPKDQVKAKYEFNYTYFPVPDDGDFRVTLSSDFVNQLKNNFNQSHQERFDRAKNSITREIVDLVSNAIVRLSNEDESAWFKATTIDSIVTYREDHAMIELLEDQDLFVLLSDLATTASIHTVQELRSDFKNRKFISDSFKAILIKASENTSLITEPIAILEEDNNLINTSSVIISSSEELDQAINQSDAIPDTQNTNTQSTDAQSTNTQDNNQPTNTQEDQSTYDQDSDINQMDALSISPDDIIMNPFGLQIESHPDPDQITQEPEVFQFFQDLSRIEELKNIENNY